MNTLTFQQHWKYPSWVQNDIRGCVRSETKSTPNKFKSGRVVYKTTFYNSDDKTIESRTAMQLVSKRTGKPYYVCETSEAIASRAARTRPPTGSSPIGADVVAPLMSELYD